MTEEMLEQHSRGSSDGRIIFHHILSCQEGPVFFIEQSNKLVGLPWTTFWYNYSGVDELENRVTVAVWRAKPKKQSS